MIDRQTNTTPANKLTRNDQGQCSYHQIFQKDVKVGDILELEHEAVVPADCVVLRVESGSSAGAAYIQTAQLDGERNLKVKLPVNDIQDAMDKVLSEELTLTVTTQEPTTNMYYF